MMNELPWENTQLLNDFVRVTVTIIFRVILFCAFLLFFAMKGEPQPSTSELSSLNMIRKHVNVSKVKQTNIKSKKEKKKNTSLLLGNYRHVRFERDPDVG